MNLKILKYNLMLAVALTGLYFTKNTAPVQTIAKVAIHIKNKTKEKIEEFHPSRNIASENSARVESLNSEDDEMDEAPSNPPGFSSPVKDQKKDEPADLTNKKSLLKTLTNKAEELLGYLGSTNLPKEKDPEVYGGGFSPKPEDPPKAIGRGQTGSCPLPSPPTGAVISLINNIPVLTWTAEQNVKFNVFKGTDPQSLTLLASGVTTNSYTDSSNTPGSIVYYKLSSTNTCGHSPEYSSILTVQSLSPLTITQKDPTEDKLSLAWTASLGATSYKVFYGLSSGNYSSDITASSPSSLTIPGGRIYFVKVQAVNSYGALDSPEVSVYVPTHFQDYFYFYSASDYSLDSGVIISNNKVMLDPSKLVSQKTINGTASTDDLPFDSYVQLDSNLELNLDLIKMHSGSTGIYISQAFDGKNDVTPWSKISFLTTLPFGKEISLSSESGYLDPVSNFSQNIGLLFHLNGTAGSMIPNGSTISSPISGQSATTYNPNNTGMQYVSAKLNEGIHFDGIDDCLITNYSQNAVTSYTVSTWIRTTTTAVKQVFVNARGSGAGKSLTLGMGTTGGGRGTSGQIEWEVDSDSIDIGISSTATYNDGQWHHVVGTWSGAPGSAVVPSQFKLFVDGQQLSTYSSATGSTIAPLSGLGPTVLGCHSPWTSKFSGDLDEVATWTRALSLSEIQELYVRGANRVKVQIRTCDQKSGNDCAGTVSSWVGAKGTNTSYFSEAYNNSIPSTNLGTVGSSIFQTPFSLFTNGLTSWLSIAKNGTNRYIQYKAVFESDTTLSYPDLSKLSFSPSPRYVTAGRITNIASKSIDFFSLSKISVTQSCSDVNLNSVDDDVRYEISLDNGGSFISFKSGAWTNSNSFSTANTKAEIEGLTSAQFTLLPALGNKLMVRSYLTSTGTTDCQIEEIKVEGSR